MALTERFGLDKPIFINLEEANPFDSQYFAYLGALAQGDLGTSYAFRDESVASMLGEALINSLWLILPAQFLAIFFGIALGVLAAWRRGTSVDVVSLTFSLFMWSLPTFFLAILLLVFGSSYLDLPTAGKETIGATTTRGGRSWSTSCATWRCPPWPSPWCCWASTC